MAIEYLGLSEINGPLVVLEGVKNASYEEIVEFRMDDGTQKIGRIIEIYEDKAVIQVFEGTDNMSLGNTCLLYTSPLKLFRISGTKRRSWMPRNPVSSQNTLKWSTL